MIGWVYKSKNKDKTVQEAYLCLFLYFKISFVILYWIEMTWKNTKGSYQSGFHLIKLGSTNLMQEEYRSSKSLNLHPIKLLWKKSL